MEKQEAEVEFDLVELLYRVFASWKLILALCIAGVLIAGCCTHFFITPMYKASSTIYVVSQKESAIDLSDLQIGTALTQDYVNVFNMWEVHDQVISELNLPYSYSYMRKHLNVTNTANTRMLVIEFTSPDPEEAAAAANKYAEVASSFISETMSTERPNTVSAALVPSSPVSPSMVKNMLLGLLAGLVVSIGFVTVRMLTDDRIKTAWDIQKYIGLMNLAVVPKERLENTVCSENEDEAVTRAAGEREVVLKKLPSLSFAVEESVNTLCTNLTFSGENVKKIMLTSCHSAEGKSFLSVNTVCTMARLGMKVALVDCDLRKSVIAGKYLSDSDSGREGIAHYLAGMKRADEIIYSVADHPNLYVVPCGRSVLNSLSLVSSPKLGELLDMLAETMDYVIVDSPPIGMLIDAAKIATYCDRTLLVVSYNAVSRRELAEARQQLDQSGCPILGTVINQTDFGDYLSRKYYHSKYYCSHYNNYYSGDSSPDKSKKRS